MVAFIIDSALIAVMIGVGMPTSFISVTTDTGLVLDTMAPSSNTFQWARAQTAANFVSNLQLYSSGIS